MNVSFVSAKPASIRSLSGWTKSFKMPEQPGGSTPGFIARISAKELKDDLDAAYQALRESFEFSRRELDPSPIVDGAGSIATPHFTYSVCVTVNPDDLSEVIWRRTVDSIKTPDQVASAAFGDVFDDVFDTLELSLPKRIKLETFIDTVEAAKPAGLKLQYDRELTYCDLVIKGVAGAVRLTSDTLSIVHGRPQATKTLVKSFDAVRKLLLKHAAPLVTLEPAKKA
jgi:hypothetical protein